MVAQFCGRVTAGSREQGFTLLEVLVAFAITALGVSLVFQIYGRAARLTETIERYDQALAVAQSIMAETGITGALEPGVEAGMVGQRLRWRRTVRPADQLLIGVAGSGSLPALYEVTVTVSWSDRQAERSLELRSVRL